MQWAEIHGINMGGFCLSFPAHPQDRGPSAGWSCRPRDRPSAACQSAWIRCGSPRWWGWRAVRTAGTIPRLARRLRIHCPGWRLLEIMNYWTRFPSICNEDHKIFANFYKLRNDSPCLCLPDWMTSSSVAPSLVFLSLSLSITSFVKYFFRREWQSDEACEFNLFMNESLYHHCLHQFHSRFFFFFIIFHAFVWIQNLHHLMLIPYLEFSVSLLDLLDDLGIDLTLHRRLQSSESLYHILVRQMYRALLLEHAHRHSFARKYRHFRAVRKKSTMSCMMKLS